MQHRAGSRIHHERYRTGDLIRPPEVIGEDYVLDVSTIADRFAPILFDLSGVKRFTSFGVREWKRSLQLLGDRPYGFIGCTPSVVSQFNMVAQFGGTGEIYSIKVPYRCEACGEIFSKPLDLLRSQNMRDLEWTRCLACGETAELEEPPESYFSYLSSIGAPQPSLATRRLLNSVDTMRVGSIRKVVEERVTLIWFVGATRSGSQLESALEGLEGEVVLCLSELTSMRADALHYIQQPAVFSSISSITKVPVEQLSQLRALQSKMVSSMVPIVCTHCKLLGEEELFEAGRASVVERKTFDAVCTNCKKVFTATLGEEALEALSSIHFSDSCGLAERTSSRTFDANWLYGDFRAQLSEKRQSNASSSKYVKLNSIGRGGMAEVHLAKQLGPEGFERLVALKCILPTYSKDDVFIKLFLEEARLAGKLSHPNLVQVFELGLLDDQYFIAMEYVRGKNLNQILRTCAAHKIAVPFPVICRILADVCMGLHAAHSFVDDQGQKRPILHRDVSTHNILVSQDGIVKLGDFGIARIEVSHSRTRSMDGKISYFAPERFSDAGDEMDPRQDIFSLGVILFICLTLSHPFWRDSEAATMHALLSEPFPDIRKRRPDIPDSLVQILGRSMVRQVEDRYSSAAQMQADLENVMFELGRVGTSNVADWITLHNLFDRAESERIITGSGAQNTLPGDEFPTLIQQDLLGRR